MAKITVWHDGNGPLCRREISLMRKSDRAGRIDFIDATKMGEGECPIDARDLLVRFHALENGKLLSGAAAFAAMWRAIPILRPIGLAARDRRFLAILEFGYRQFLRVRPRLQRMAVRVEGL